MKHYMHLNNEPFSQIAKGTKTIELRLYDEKRKKISVGDLIIFTNSSDDSAEIIAEVKALHIFDSFEELYSALPLDKCGYDTDNIANASAEDMSLYYTHEEQAEYGVVGIEVEVIRTDASREYIKIGRFISLILRHHPDIIGITLDKNGWAKVDDLIDGVNKKYPLDFETLEKIVRSDNKQRYSFNSDKTLIRANQGHSIDVDVEPEKLVPPQYLWHGSAEKYVESINANGLIPKSRLYVHLSPDYETAFKVGSRHGKSVVYRVEARKMHDMGYEFFRSVNNVWLVKSVPVDFLQKE